MCLWIPELLAASAYLLGEIKVHGANLRDPVKGYGHQDLHVDVPKKFAGDWWVVNSMIMFNMTRLMLMHREIPNHIPCDATAFSFD